MNVGRMIFYDKISGEVIVNTGQYENIAVKKTVEQQIATFTALSERNRETFDVIELPFGFRAQDFAECLGYRVDVAELATLAEDKRGEAIKFAYPDPNAPTEPPVYVVPLTEQIAEKEAKINELKLLVTQVSDDLALFMDYQLAREEEMANGGV
jgi:hypothetical protein